jgi:L-threonylcarbamoyladenylate synthase
MTAPRVTTDVDEALDVIVGGGLVAIPTETVYGLAADASNEAAVRRIFAAKGRPADHPLIVHVAAGEQLPVWADGVPPAAATLAAFCWPGPLTLLVPRAAHVLDVVTGGRSTVGVRVPAHPLTTDLLTRFAGQRGTRVAGVAAPSANRFGRVSPTTAAHVVADLGDAVDLVLDGGPCPVGVESTIVDCSVSPPQVLRPGGIATEEIERVLGVHVAPASGPSRAAGMMASHYAPECPVLLADDADAADRLAAGQRAPLVVGVGVDDVTYAQRLYEWLRSADTDGRSAVIAVMPPAAGLGHAIRDRLMKAAAHRAG